jgi:predicted metalloprotease with PDZ domain
VAIRRAGIIDDDRYAAALTTMLNTVINGRGRRYHTPIEMSMQAPFVDAAVSVDPHNRANTFLSYYTWGAAIGLGLDLSLRTRFDGLSLDHYLRALWQRHGRSGAPYTLDDLFAALAALTGGEAFAAEFFDRYIGGSDVPDYAALLARAGFLLRRAAPGQASLGPIPLQEQGGRVTVAGNTLVGTPWRDAGVGRLDRLVSLDGEPIAAVARIAELAAGRRPGETAMLVFEQRGRERTAMIRFVENEQLEVVTFEAAGETVTPEMLALREAWLGSKLEDRR